MKKVVLLIFWFLLFFSCVKIYKKDFTLKKGYVEKGIASYYGKEFEGKKTASGELFDPNKLTAAHRYLPFDTVIKVTNLENGKVSVLRVNDRGPFVKGRILDCSEKGAKELGFYLQGTARVKIEVIKEGKEKISPTTEIVVSKNKNVLDGSFTIQVGAFLEIENAKRLCEIMDKKYGDSYIVKYKDFYRVRVGHYKSINEAEFLLKLIEESGIEGFITRND